jgi:prepilin-type N-terminal cleavage/methylation domain-containing protein
MNNRISRTKGRTSGFTLIELLVVVAIISVLAAMLLPALSRAKEASKRSRCIGNVRQLTVGVLLYHDENGVFPWTEPGMGNWTRVYPYLGIQNGESLMNQNHVLFCPSAVNKPVTYDTMPYELRVLGGGFRQSVGGDWSANNGDACYGINFAIQAQPHTQVASPYMTFCVMESTYAYVYYFCCDPPVYRHGGSAPSGEPAVMQLMYRVGAEGFHSSFVDGHVEWIPMQKYVNWMFPGGYGSPGNPQQGNPWRTL